MFDPRPLGSLLAGMPCSTSKPGGGLPPSGRTDKIQNRLEEAYGMPNLAAESPYGGCAAISCAHPGSVSRILRSKGLINEVAASAGADSTNSAWTIRPISDSSIYSKPPPRPRDGKQRPSPRGVRSKQENPVTGRGVAIIVRQNAYWVGIAEIAIVPATKGTGNQVHHRWPIAAKSSIRVS